MVSGELPVGDHRGWQDRVLREGVERLPRVLSCAALPSSSLNHNGKNSSTNKHFLSFVSELALLRRGLQHSTHTGTPHLDRHRNRCSGPASRV